MLTFIKRNGATLRAVAVVGVVGALVTSVTYASLQSPSATLTGNTIQTANANLLVGTASATSSAFAPSKAGFTFNGIVPGVSASSDSVFYLRNSGTAGLNVRLAIGSTPTNTANVDLTKVNISITRFNNGIAGTTQSATIQSLIDGYPANGLLLNEPLTPNSSSTAVQYKINIDMTGDAFTGNSASVSGIDFVFSATAANIASVVN